MTVAIAKQAILFNSWFAFMSHSRLSSRSIGQETVRMPMVQLFNLYRACCAKIWMMSSTFWIFSIRM
jgi:hypothetical protein